MSKHALIFDIDALSSMVVQNELIEIGFTSFDWSPDGAEAVHLAQVRCPDLIVAGELTGVENTVLAVEEICRDKPIPVVFVVAGGSRPDAPFPASVVLPISFRPEDFRKAVESACQIVEHQNLTVWQSAATG